MALALTNCHLEKAGFSLFPCVDSQSITTCLSPMSDMAFNVYTTFFTHTQNICFFLQSQIWHQQTEKTVSKLAKNSELVADQLEVTSNLQSEMMKKQNVSMQNQEMMLRNEEHLRDSLKTSADSVRDIFEEMKSSTNQQQLLFDKTFERVTEIQRLILGEFSWIHSLLFYLAAVVIVYLMTSTPRTAGARLCLFLVFAFSWVAERLVFNGYREANEETIYANLWLCRKIFCAVAIIVLLICAYLYKDYNHMNHKLLLELHAKVAYVLNGQTTDETDFSAVPLTSNQKALTAPSSLAAIKSPYNETLDITYTPNKSDYSSDSGTESFVSAVPGSRKPSRPSTPDMLDMDGSTLNASSLNSSVIDSSKLTITSKHGDVTLTVKKRGRPKGRKNNVLNASTPITNTSLRTPYNLRRRSQQFSPNPLLDQETVDMFIKTVEGRRMTRQSPAKITEIY